MDLWPVLLLPVKAKKACAARMQCSGRTPTCSRMNFEDLRYLPVEISTHMHGGKHQRYTESQLQTHVDLERDLPVEKLGACI